MLGMDGVGWIAELGVDLIAVGWRRSSHVNEMLGGVCGNVCLGE